MFDCHNIKKTFKQKINFLFIQISLKGCFTIIQHTNPLNIVFDATLFFFWQYFYLYTIFIRNCLTLIQNSVRDKNSRYAFITNSNQYPQRKKEFALYK